MPSADALTEAFLWSEYRTVTKTATVSLHGNTYQVDPGLVGRKVELVFSPFDLETVEVRYHDRSHGPALPHHITRHAHPKARPETPEPAPAPATGIDYLQLVTDDPPPAGRRRRADRLRRPLHRRPGGRTAAHHRHRRKRSIGMSIQRLQAYYGFTRMPFGRGLAPSMLHRHAGHAEAVARISWCVDQHALGVITGEVGAGKTVAVRAATAALDTSRHVVIYLPNPSVGVRGMLHHVVAALGQVPSFYTATLVPQAAAALAAEHAERGRTPVVVFDEAHLLDNAQLEAVRMLTNHDMDSGAPFAALLVGQPTLRHRLRLGVLAALDQRIAVRYALAGMTASRDRGLHHPPRQDRRPGRHPVQRRRRHTDPQRLPRLPAGGQQPRRQRTHLRVRREELHRRREGRPHRHLRNRRRLNPSPHRRARHAAHERPRPLRGQGLPHIRTIGTDHDGNVCILSDGVIRLVSRQPQEGAEYRWDRDSPDARHRCVDAVVHQNVVVGWEAATAPATAAAPRVVSVRTPLCRPRAAQLYGRCGRCSLPVSAVVWAAAGIGCRGSTSSI